MSSKSQQRRIAIIRSDVRNSQKLRAVNSDTLGAELVANVYGNPWGAVESMVTKAMRRQDTLEGLRFLPNERQVLRAASKAEGVPQSKMIARIVADFRKAGRLATYRANRNRARKERKALQA